MVNGFTSGRRAQLGLPLANHDPYPFVWKGHSEINQMRTDTDVFRKGAPYALARYHHRPRPEFAVLDNPILAELRRFTSTGLATPREAMELILSLVRRRRWEKLPAASWSQIDHARRVLQKLAALA